MPGLRVLVANGNKAKHISNKAKYTFPRKSIQSGQAHGIILRCDMSLTVIIRVRLQSRTHSLWHRNAIQSYLGQKLRAGSLQRVTRSKKRKLAAIPNFK